MYKTWLHHYTSFLELFRSWWLHCRYRSVMSSRLRIPVINGRRPGIALSHAQCIRVSSTYAHTRFSRPRCFQSASSILLGYRPGDQGNEDPRVLAVLASGCERFSRGCATLRFFLSFHIARRPGNLRSFSRRGIACATLGGRAPSSSMIAADEEFVLFFILLVPFSVLPN